MHGGSCSDGVQRYFCNCTDTGYEGKQCENGKLFRWLLSYENVASAYDFNRPGFQCVLINNKILSTRSFWISMIFGLQFEVATKEWSCSFIILWNCYISCCFIVTDIDDCTEFACSNGGKCIDEWKGFSCNCSGTGFEGKTCEIGKCQT